MTQTAVNEGGQWLKRKLDPDSQIRVNAVGDREEKRTKEMLFPTKSMEN